MIWVMKVWNRSIYEGIKIKLKLIKWTVFKKCWTQQWNKFIKINNYRYRYLKIEVKSSEDKKTCNVTDLIKRKMLSLEKTSKYKNQKLIQEDQN